MRRRIRLIGAALTVLLIVLGAISYRAITSHRIRVLHTREAVLQDNLFKMRTLIDQYAADKGSFPKSLDQLVSAGYLRQLPEDPFTGQKDWVEIVGPDPNSSKGEDGIIDVRSASRGISLQRSPYKEW